MTGCTSVTTVIWRNLMLTGDWTVTGLTDAIGGIILGGVIRLGNQATSI
jgi:hypothetical protein